MFQRACRVIPGGTSSPFRSFKAVGGTPRFLARGEGPYVFDSEARRYVDYVCGWEALILGHAHPAVRQAAFEAISLGTLFGAPHPWEVELAEAIREAVPSMEMVRFVNSGTEAVQSAVRLARGFTRRTTVIRFEGSYHGHVDSLIEAVGSEHEAPWGLSEAGIPPGLAAETLTIPYNSPEALQQALSPRVAAVIVEPVCGSMGVVAPTKEFLEALRTLPAAHGALVIFDEVMTGFRLAYGGAQEYYGITADLTCLGKALGGGFAVGAYGGRQEIMERLLPDGAVYQAGTFSGNPLTMRAALETLKQLKGSGAYDRLGLLTSLLAEELERIGVRHGIPLSVPRVGSLFAVMFLDHPPVNYREARQTDVNRYARFFHGMLDAGHYFPPSPWDAACLSLAHREEEIRATLEAAEQVIHSLSPGGHPGPSP